MPFVAKQHVLVFRFHRVFAFMEPGAGVDAIYNLGSIKERKCFTGINRI